MEYTDQLLDVDAILKTFVKDCNSQKETWTLTGGGMRTYHHPFKVELTYEKCGSYEEKKSCFYIVKSNHDRGEFLLQTEGQRFGYVNTGYGLGGTDGTEISIWKQNNSSSFMSNKCKGIRNRLKVSADILMYKANAVPVGEDQVPHVELTREIGRRFNTLYKETFPEPQALLTQVPRLPGLDGRKMSKSYNNDISLSDSPEKIWQKIKGMMTDPARKRRHDPGNPDICPVYSYHKIYSSEETKQVVQRDCRTAKIGCVDCKKWMSNTLIKDLTPLLDSRREYVSRKGDIQDIINDGNNRAAEVAKETMQEVRQAVKFSV